MEPIELAKNSDFIFTMLGYPHDVEEVILHPTTGILSNMKEGSILIDHTTSSPGLAEKIYNVAKERGIFSLDAPVSGGDIGARNGTLVTMTGGDKEAFEKAFELLKCYSS